ncbi:ferritin-like domain-containing protein [Streptomyces niveus]|uniref:ferritin-like domain-containing protein n=1 Tax=Streptomyces niveus TaxID=193462 RepID=UPI00364F9668
MSSRDLYVHTPDRPVWAVPATGAARFQWDYDDGRERLLALYQKGKDKQWDSSKRIDWDLEVDPYEARHAEIYGRFLHEKVGMLYPVNDSLQGLLGDTLRDSRWDIPYLGMQVLIEGLALAAFGMIRDTTNKPLPKQILAYVMQDEARHVAFGRMALRDYYRQLSDAELREREEFVIEGCYLMRDRLRGVEVLENFGVPRAEADELSERSEFLHLFRKLLFSRIVPCVKDIGLWGERLQKAYLDMGVFDLGDSSLDLLMSQDEEIAERLDRERFAAEERARVAEVADAIALGAADDSAADDLATSDPVVGVPAAGA